MDAGAQLHGGREAERPTMWLMSDFEALAFIATVALMVMLALVVASARQVVRQRVTYLGFAVRGERNGQPREQAAWASRLICFGGSVN
jgi:predicted small integral membrane protein